DDSPARAHQHPAHHVVDVQRLHAVPAHRRRAGQRVADAAGVHLQDGAPRPAAPRLRLGVLAAAARRQPDHRGRLHPLPARSTAMTPRYVVTRIAVYVAVCLATAFFALPLLWLVLTPFSKHPSYRATLNGVSF